MARVDSRVKGGLMAARARPEDRRRQILDAAVRVFARQGFHGCRVSDIADEAGIAYGLVYHYFGSKEALLDTVFLERWEILLEAIASVRSRRGDIHDKLYSVAGFIIDSYRHDPELMKVIIVEVTRAANSFGVRHLAKIREAYDAIAAIVLDAQRSGTLRTDIDADFAAMAFYGAIEQVLTAWIFGVLEQTDEAIQDAKRWVVVTICDGLHATTPMRVLD